MGEPAQPLGRPADDRWLGGVASGMAAHISLPPTLVRLAFLVLSGFGGFGVLLYGALWIAVPPTATDSQRTIRSWLRSIIRPESLLLATVALAVAVRGDVFDTPVPWELLAAAYGAALTWRQADLRRKDHSEPKRWSRLRTASGALLVVAAAASVLEDATDLAQLRQGIVAVVVVLVAVALVTGPWWLRTVQALGSERTERIRSQERAELAARVHDSVLQTLTLIQRNADDPRAVHRYARRQERNLRELLYRPAAATGQFSSALEAKAAEVEDRYGVTIETVVVGDCPLDERVSAIVEAATEAMVNAAKSSGVDEFDVFAEVEAAEVTVFVRDRGIGFDLAAVGPQRAGIRESIVGRMQRAGGAATVRTAPGAGTEVKLSVVRR